jgi:hypothetical protein
MNMKSYVCNVHVASIYMHVTSTKHACNMNVIPYSGKFLWGPIFADGQSSKFSWFNFRGCGVHVHYTPYNRTY